MSDGTLPIELAGEGLLLHPERALLWPAQRTLFIADLHLGKDEIFRCSGIPIPQGTTQTDLLRLQNIIQAHGVARVILLGDFLHGASAQTPTHAGLFDEWRAAHAAIEFIVIAGNHDRRAARNELRGVQWEDQGLRLGPFLCRHHPPSAADQGYVLCGHVHPAIRLEGFHRERARVPVCWVRRDHAVLPSFGSFTGGANIELEASDSAFAFAAGQVWRVP